MADLNDKSMFKWMGWIAGCCAVVAVILFILFLQNQEYDTSLPFDTGIFGTYGDFVGGVLGTIVALYTAYLLIKTFQNQANINSNIEKTNKSVVDANNSIIAANQKADIASQRQFYQTELQLFDSKFRSFLDAYQSAIDHYEKDNHKGRIAFEQISQDFINRTFDNSNDYKRRCDSATDEYLMFYAEYQTMLSVHLRLLYLLVSLVSHSELDEPDKVQYAKLIRGQMSNMEMLIERYNCRSPFGMKMQVFCNQYNLTKHLPVMNLLEFKSYRETICRDEIEVDNAEKLLSGLNSMFISLRKKTTGMLYDGEALSDEYKTSHHYIITLTCSQERDVFTLSLKNDKSVVRQGGGTRISPEEKALDKIADDILPLFKDFLSELFIVSNFDIYNSGATIRQVGPTVNNTDEYSFVVQVYNNKKRLVLSYIQMNKRDNPEDNLEN